MSLVGFNEILFNLRQSTIIFLLVFIFYVFLVLLKNRRVNRTSLSLLKAIILSFFIVHFVSSLIAFNVINLYIILLFLYLPALLCIAPLSYLYILSVTSEDFNLRRSLLFHMFVPAIFFIVSLIINVPLTIYYYLGNDAGMDIWISVFKNVSFFGLNIILTAQFLYYSTSNIHTFHKYRKSTEHYFSFSDGVRIDWLPLFIFCVVSFVFLVIISNNEYLFVKFIPDGVYDLIYYGITFVFVSIIGLYGSSQLNYYDIEKKQAIKSIKANIDNNTEYYGISEDSLLVSNQNENILSEELQNELIEKITNCMNEEKVYLKSSLTLVEMAKRIGTNRGYLSKIINEHFQMSFYTFINTYRIQEAQKILSDEAYDIYSLDGIAELCGFSSRSVLSKTFKKLTGETPTEFKQRVRNSA